MLQAEPVATPFCEFWGERMTLATAEARCGDFGGVCNFNYVLNGNALPDACDSTYR